MINDEKFYQQVLDELRTEGPREALWFKSVAECDGDEVRAQHLYVRYRVEQLKTDAIRSRSEARMTKINETLSDLGHAIGIVLGIVIVLLIVILLA